MAWLGCGGLSAQGLGGVAPTAKPAFPEERARTRTESSSAMHVPRLTAPLTLADFTGMQPREPLRDKLARIDGFTQNQPQDGKPPTERTEVWMGRTQTMLYVVFACYDSRPSTIRTHLARRENVLKDDSVTVLLDPFQDRRRGVLFQVNPLGVQADASWQEGKDPDYSYDQVWDSEGRRTAQGWIALLAIPFRSIRSRATSPQWGVVLSRNLPRNSEVDYWPRVSQQISGTLSQEGALSGMEGATSRNVQINPYGLAHNLHALNQNDPLRPYFENRKLQGTAGGEIKAVVKDSVVLDGTINPDFSQIESDEPQFTVNQRFQNFYPELRPFFLENASYFSTPILLVYTRTLRNPEFGARATGKLHHTNLGFFEVDDRAPGRELASSDPNYQKRAHTTVARISQDIGKFSSVGGIYTDREFAGSWNRIGGLDFDARLSPKWELSGQAVASSTKRLDGSYLAGPASRLSLSREGHSFFFYNTYKDYSGGFASDAGFIRVSAIRENRNNIGYTWFPKHSLAQNLGVQMNSDVAFDRAGHRAFHYTEDEFIVQLPRSTLLVPFAGQNSDTIAPGSGTAVTRFTNFTQNYGGVLVRSSPIPQLSINVNVARGATPNYNPAAGALPGLLHQTTSRAYITLQPVNGLTIDNTYLLDSDRSGAGAFVYENQTLRTKINYQFTRALSARAIVEYDSLLANPLETSLQRTKQVSTEVLLTWLPHPGTAIYLGYDSNLQNLDRALCNRGTDGQCDPNNTTVPRSTQYLNDGRQIFLKASYLLRF